MLVKYGSNEESFWIPSHRKLQSNSTYSLESRPIQLAPHRATHRVPLFRSSLHITSKENNNHNQLSLEKAFQRKKVSQFNFCQYKTFLSVLSRPYDPPSLCTCQLSVTAGNEIRQFDKGWTVKYIFSNV